MTTKLIGLKEFRQNIARLTNTVKKGGVRLIILRKNVPVLEVKSIDEKTFALEKFARDVKKARASVKRGDVFTPEQIAKHLGL